MKILAGILLGIAVILFFVYISLRRKLELLTETQTRNVKSLAALEKKDSHKPQLTEVKGTIICDNPLISELSQTACIYYNMQVVREYEETYHEKDSDGVTQQKTRTSTQTVASNERSTPFFVEDATGKIRVEPSGAKMIAEKVLSRYEKSDNRLRIGNFIISPDFHREGQRVLGYRFEEHVIPLDRTIYVLGAVTESRNELCIVAPEERGKFIISLKGEAELTRDYQVYLKWTGWIGLVCGIAGTALLTI